MIYTKLTKLAIRLAFAAHDGQIGRDGLPYVCHPLHVAERMDDETSTCVALLHDIIEDCPSMTPERLRAEGIPDGIVWHVLVLTRRPDETYADYVGRVACDEVATKVKIADLEHNLNASRLDGELPDSLWGRYDRARARLLDTLSDRN